MDMRKINAISKKTLIAIVITVLIFSFFILNASNARSMSKSKYQAFSENITKEFKAAKLRCESLVDNFKELCDARVKGARDISRAELEASFKPTIQNRYDANMISAVTNHSIATMQCDGLKATEIDACKTLTKETYLRDTSNARSLRNSEKLGEIAKDKTVKNDESSEKFNLYMNDVFNSVYLVKA